MQTRMWSKLGELASLVPLSFHKSTDEGGWSSLNEEYFDQQTHLGLITITIGTH